MHRLQIERLLLSQTSATEKQYFFALLQNPQVLQFCFDMPTPAEIQQQFESRLIPWNTTSTHWLSLSIYEKASSSFIGIIGLKMDHSCEARAEIGFLLLPESYGKGYATEAVVATQKYAAAIGIQTITAKVTKGNWASSRVLEKCGFVLQRELLESICINQVFYTDLEYQWLVGRLQGISETQQQ